MNILRIVRSANPASGGPIEAVRQTGTLHHVDGHRVDVLTLDSPDAVWLTEFPFTVIGIGGVRRGYGYCSSLTAWLKARVKDYDCVIIEGLWQYHSYGAWRVLRSANIPYFVFTHGMLDPWFKKTFPLKHFKKWIYWNLFEHKVLRDAAGVLFTCEEERRLARRSFYKYQAKEIVVEFGTAGVPSSESDYVEPFIDKHPGLRDKRRFVFLGRVHPKKGPDILIKAFAHILADCDPTFRAAPVQAHSHPFTSPLPFVLIMAGPADGAYAAKLKALAEQLGVSDRIYWTGMLRGDDKWGALQCSEAFLLPSHQENFGIAVAEALSVGVPVLISKSVNIWADIVEAGAGIADEDSVDGCVRQWSQWLGLSTEAREALSARARTVFEQRYTSGKAAESLIQHITQAAKSA